MYTEFSIRLQPIKPHSTSSRRGNSPWKFRSCEVYKTNTATNVRTQVTARYAFIRLNLFNSAPNKLGRIRYMHTRDSKMKFYRRDSRLRMVHMTGENPAIASKQEQKSCTTKMYLGNSLVPLKQRQLVSSFHLSQRYLNNPTTRVQKSTEYRSHLPPFGIKIG